MVPSNHIPAPTSTTKNPSITAFSTVRLPRSSGGSGSPLPPSVIGASRLWRIEMNIAAIVDDTIARFRIEFTFPKQGTCLRQIARPDRRLAVAAGNIEHVVRLAQPGDPPSHVTHQLLPVLKGGAQMCRAGREIAVMQVIGFYAAFDKGPHQRFKPCTMAFAPRNQPH